MAEGTGDAEGDEPRDEGDGEVPPAPPASTPEVILGRGQVPDAEADVDETVTERRPLTVTFRAATGRLSLSVGMFLSVDYLWAADAPRSAPEGFSVTDARLVLDGEIGEDWRYVLSGDFAAPAPGLVDLRVSYRPAPWLRVQVGRFKVPVSGEFLVPDADLDLIRLVRVVAGVAPGRSIGLEVGGQLDDRRLFWRLGVFDGRRDLRAPGSGGVLLAARVGTRIPTGPGEGGRIALAFNVARGIDEESLGLRFFDAPFAGDRRVLGADLRGSWGPVTVAAELLAGTYWPSDPGTPAGGPVPVPGQRDVWGSHVTVIGRVTSWAAVLLRWDRLVDERPETPRDLLIPSFTVVVPDAAPVSFQLDGNIPVTAPERTEITANATVAF